MSSNNEGTVSKRVKKELLSFTTQMINDLIEKFYHDEVAEGSAERTCISIKKIPDTLRIFSTTKVLTGIPIPLRLMGYNYVVFMKN